jgi:LmbE family N-acetylglucosaminyl deacetylase
MASAFIDPDVLGDCVVVLAPHVDDEVLACGGTVARLRCKDRVYFVYATDGSRSPAPDLPWVTSVPADLATVREAEAKEAACVLGVPSQNLHFLRFPDGQLQRYQAPLRAELLAFLRDLRPDCILAPFRYDRHPDHLALNRAATTVAASLLPHTALLEYFIYYRSRLLPGGDVRRFVHPDRLVTVDITTEGMKKRQALECFKSQTTRYFPWQDRPILTGRSLDEACANPEMYVRYDPAQAGHAVFRRASTWIRIMHQVEPGLKRRKDYALALLRHMVKQRG